MPSISALQMRTALLSGTYTAVTFQTALATAANSAAFTELANSYGSAEMLVNSTTAFPVIAGSSTARTIATNAPAFLRACANSGYATEQLVTTADGAELFGIVLRDATGSRFSHWRNFTNNYNLIKSFVNKSGSKLKRQIFTSTGPWTAPATIKAMSIFGVGGGSSGNKNTSGGYGGGGGEIECINIDQGSLPSVNQTVTIGSGGVFASPSGVSTTVGTLITASGATYGGVNAGGGSTTNGGYINFTDWESPLTAAFQCFSGSQKGGDGGTAVNAILGLPGSDGLPGSGGNPSYGTSSAEQASGGRAYGGGGGSGGGTSTTSGGDAAANTGGGGGGGDGAFSVAGNGGSGIAVIYWLEG